ncbi:helix-turn-helix domain-containing protein [Streptomyces sasae]|uniref:helix-turn-helix domain-containing protein n=1 Tax=Streptomyces sasae TaxID=1266772 RepID=UPI00292DBFF1|nr:helix-turn-helix domain-containing protein [Streptomyces sasae]
MKADRGRKYRLYPTPGQEEVLTAWGHSARALWNVALERRQYAHKQRGVALRSSRAPKELPNSQVPR